MMIKEAYELSADGELEGAWRRCYDQYCASTWNQVEHVYLGLRPRGKEVTVAVVFVALFAISYLLAVICGRSFGRESLLDYQLRRNFFGFHNQTDGFHNQAELPKVHKRARYNQSLDEILENAALPNKTVIIVALNAAWAENNTMIDLFLEGLHAGNGTERLLKHLVIVAFDHKAFNRCIDIHEHCLKIETPGVDFSEEKLFLSADYKKMMWRRIQFLGTVLEKGYSFIFTDGDILWLRDPFPRLREAGIEQQEVDMAIASDHFVGNAFDVAHNKPNTGFIYARASDRTSRAYSYWYEARERHHRMMEQAVFNSIKLEQGFQAIGLRLRFLDPQFFAGFCTIGKSDMGRVVTMHSTCCKGLFAKLHDLRSVLHRWNFYRAHAPANSSIPSPSECQNSWPPRPSPKPRSKPRHRPAHNRPPANR